MPSPPLIDLVLDEGSGLLRQIVRDVETGRSCLVQTMDMHTAAMSSTIKMQGTGGLVLDFRVLAKGLLGVSVEDLFSFNPAAKFPVSEPQVGTRL
jgi:hypothetical protein